MTWIPNQQNKMNLLGSVAISYFIILYHLQYPQPAVFVVFNSREAIAEAIIGLFLVAFYLICHKGLSP